MIGFSTLLTAALAYVGAEFLPLLLAKLPVNLFRAIKVSRVAIKVLREFRDRLPEDSPDREELDKDIKQLQGE